jgi:peptidoglycan hydrolase CwlO-like protein
MPKSRVRKNHKQKVKARNERLKAAQKKFEKQYMTALEEQFKQFESLYSGLTETEQTTEEPAQ